MEVNNKVAFKQVAGDQTSDSRKSTSASPTTPSPEIRNQQVATAIVNEPDLWPKTQQLTIQNTTNNTPVTGSKTSQTQGQKYDLSVMKLEFSKDKETGKIVVKIIDQNTDKVIRQVPPQEFLNIVHSMNQAAKDLLKRIPKTI